jgi:hypothetical protein
MILHTTQEDVEFTLEGSIFLDAYPKLYLDCLNLSFSVFDSYSDAHIDNSVFGAFRWLDQDLDALLFSKKDSLFIGLELYLILTPYIKIEPRKFQFIDSHKQGRLKCLHKEGFWLNQTNDVRYYEENDFIVLYYPDYKDDISITGYKLSNNFFIFLQNDIIIGWGLEKCTEYLYSREIKSYDTHSKNTQPLLVKYFQLINNGVFEKMNDKDLIVKNEIIELLSLAKQHGVFSMCDSLLDWLDNNY